MKSKDHVMFYRTVIMPVLEYECPTWHTGCCRG